MQETAGDADAGGEEGNAERSEDVSEGNVSEGNGGGRKEARITAAHIQGESASVTGAASLEELGGA